MYAHQKKAWKMAHRSDWLIIQEQIAATGIPKM